MAFYLWLDGPFLSQNLGLLLLLLLFIRVFHISVSWWSFTGDWVTTNLLKSPGLFSVFWPFSIMLFFWTVSTRPPTSKSSSPFNNLLVTVPKAPITIAMIVTLMFHSFFNSLAKSRYLSLFSHYFSFILSSAGTANSTILLIFFFLLIIIRSGLLAKIRWSVGISKFLRGLCVSLLLLFTPLEFFTSVLADGFLLESEWQQVFSGLQDSSLDSGCSQQCCYLDSLYSSANLQVLQAF